MFDPDYLDDLWWFLHHSEGDGDCVLGLTFYLDDSGSNDPSPLVTCGGLALSRIRFKEFSRQWEAMLSRSRFSGYTLESPLHMKDFVASGKYSGMPPEFKRAIFRDVARMIRDQRLYSLSVAVDQAAFQVQLPESVTKTLIGPYAFAFFSLVLAHQTLSERLSEGALKCSYIVDTGFNYQDQLNRAHQIVVDFEKASGGFRHTGALATDSDDRVPALQAADAIAWASRRVAIDGKLPEGFEPLREVLNESDGERHVTIPINAENIKLLSDPVNNWISKRGTVPSLKDFVTRTFGGVRVKLP